jgi:subtilisin family serine protease
MGRRLTLLLTWLSVALITAFAPLVSFAQVAPRPISTVPTQAAHPGLAHPASHVAALIELRDPPAATNTSTASALRSRDIAAAQAALLPAIRSAGADVLFQTRFAANGIAVRIPPDRLDVLRQLPGVARVSIVAPKLPASIAGTPALGLAPVASAVAGATGRGVRIGIIDRGADYTHADFGGPGTPAAYATNDPTIVEPGSFPPSKIAGGADLAGDGYDAGGVSGSPMPTADPDPLECNRPDPAHPNPAIGQGTLVAGLAAGFGVAADGSTYHGAYGPGVDLSTLKIQPGIAPEAQLYPLKVFGCNGSTALLTSAIDHAIDPDGNGNPSDHLDILVISIGTPFGSPDDPDALAVDAAVRLGIVVVVAAGDTVNTFYSVSSPASARLAITVGAADGARVAAISARGPLRGNDTLKPDLVAPGVATRSAAVGTGAEAMAMTGTAMAAAQVAGAAALVREQHPSWTPAQIKAALLNTASPMQAPPSLAGAGLLNPAGLATASVLAYGTGGSFGLAYGAPWVAYATTTTRTLRLENTGDSAQSITLSATHVATETGVTLTVPAGAIVVPPHGTADATIQLAIDPSGLEYSPDSATALLQDGFARHFLAEQGGSIQVSTATTNGTRVRPGHAAHFGPADFYLDDRLLDDSLDSREIKPYVSTTPGSHTVNLRAPGASPGSTPIFSAPVTLADNKDYTVLVIGRPGALGVLVVDDTVATPPPAGQGVIHYVNANRTEPGWNVGPLDVYLDGTLRVAALAVGATSDYFPIAPGEHEVTFYKAGSDPMIGRRVAHKVFTVAAGEAILAGTGRHDDDDGDLSDDEQRVIIGRSPVRVSGMVLARVPYNVFPIVAADARAAGNVVVTPGSQSFAVDLHNAGARNAGLIGTLGTPHTPLASAFELTASSPARMVLSPTQRAADVQYLGVTSNYSLTQNLATTRIYFGLATYAPWSTPNEVQVRVYIDSNRDGVDDYVLLNTNSGWVSDRAPTDVFFNSLYQIRPDGTFVKPPLSSLWETFQAPGGAQQLNVAPFNSSVMFQMAILRDLGLPADPANAASPKGPPPSSFCYHVETRSRDLSSFAQAVDRVPADTEPGIAACANRSGQLLYDVQNYAIAPINVTNFIFAQSTTARPLFLDIESGRVTGAVNWPTLATRSRVQMLVLHHHNAPYPQAEIVEVVKVLTVPIGTSARSP